MLLVPTTDQKVLSHLDEVCFPDDEPIDFENTYWWIIRDMGIPVAFCGLKLFEDNTGFLCRSGVHPIARGQGYQRKMIRCRQKFAQSLGLDACVTYTLNTNPTSSNNLIKEGYRLFWPEEGEEWAGEDVLYWIREIDEPDPI